MKTYVRAGLITALAAIGMILLWSRIPSDHEITTKPQGLLELGCYCDAALIDAPIEDAAIDAPIDAPIDAGVPCAPGIHLVVIKQQSNGQGRDYAANLTPPERRTELETPFAAVPMAQWISTSPPPAGQSIVWKSRPFEPTQPRLIAMGGTNPGAMGIELSMARVLDAACPGQFAIAKVTIGGTGWRQHWNNPGFPTVGDSLNTQYMQFVASAKSSIGAVDVLAVVPIGGEFDTNSSVDANDVGEQMLASDEAFRAVYPDALDIFAQLGSGAITGPYKPIVRAEQAAYATTCTRCAMAITDGYQYVDNVHYRANSLDALGIQVGNLILSNM